MMPSRLAGRLQVTGYADFWREPHKPHVRAGGRVLEPHRRLRSGNWLFDCGRIVQCIIDRIGRPDTHAVEPPRVAAKAEINNTGSPWPCDRSVLAAEPSTKNISNFLIAIPEPRFISAISTGL